MHDLNILLNFVGQNKRVGICLGLGKDNSFTLATVAREDISEGTQTILEGTTDCQVSHGGGRLVLEVLAQIDDPHGLLHMLVGDILDPAGNRC